MVILLLELAAVGGGVLSLLPRLSPGVRGSFRGMSLLAATLLALNLLGAIHL